MDTSEKPVACQSSHSHLRRDVSCLRFVAKSQSRVARPTRGGAQDRGVLEKYIEGLSDEPVGLARLAVARLVAAADLRLQQNRYALLKRVTLANTIAAKGRARPNNNCTMRSEPRWL